MSIQTINLARSHMRVWALQWRTFKAIHDKQGMEIALNRAVIWRDTFKTLKNNYFKNTREEANRFQLT